MMNEPLPAHDTDEKNTDSGALADVVISAHMIEREEMQRFESLKSVLSLEAINENEEAQQVNKYSSCLENDLIPNLIACNQQMDQSFISTIDSNDRNNNADETNDLDYSVDSDGIIDELLSVNTKNKEDGLSIDISKKDNISDGKKIGFSNSEISSIFRKDTSKKLTNINLIRKSSKRSEERSNIPVDQTKMIPTTREGKDKTIINANKKTPPQDGEISTLITRKDQIPGSEIIIDEELHLTEENSANVYQDFSFKSGSLHKASWKSTSSPGVLEKVRKREVMMEKFQTMLVKVKSGKPTAKNNTLDNKNSIDISTTSGVKFSISQVSSNAQSRSTSAGSTSHAIHNNLTCDTSYAGSGAQSRDDSEDNTSRMKDVQKRDGKNTVEILSRQKHTTLIKSGHPKPLTAYAQEVLSSYAQTESLPRIRTEKEVHDRDGKQSEEILPRQKHCMSLKNIHSKPLTVYAQEVLSSYAQIESPPKRKIDGYRYSLQSWKERQEKNVNN